MAKSAPTYSPEELAQARTAYAGFLEIAQSQQDHLRTLIPDEPRNNAIHHDVSPVGNLLYFLRAFASGETILPESKKAYLHLIERICRAQSPLTHAPFELKHWTGPTREDELEAIKSNYSKLIVLPGSLTP